MRKGLGKLLQGQQKLKKDQMHLEVLEEKRKGKQRKGKAKCRKVRGNRERSDATREKVSKVYVGKRSGATIGRVTLSREKVKSD